MNILAVVPYAGDKTLVDMTANMLTQLRVQQGLLFDSELRHVVAVSNAAEAHVDAELLDQHYFNPRNEGFGPAVNMVINLDVFDAPLRPYDYVLVLNNDLEFPDPQWLAELILAADGEHVITPCTDRTATLGATAKSAVDKPSFFLREVSAFCWMVPIKVIKAVKKSYYFPLFPPEFPNYGSDDAASAILRKLLGPKPFKVVPRAWVRHLKAKTSKQLGVKAGTPELLGQLAAFKKKWSLT